MFRQYLENIAGISIFPVISLVIFFAFFAILIAYLIKTRGPHFDEVSRLPLNSADIKNEKSSNV